VALIECHECGKSISSQAASCPHCGAPLSAPSVSVARKKSHGAGCAVAIVLFLAFVGFVMFVNNNRTPEQKAADERDQQNQSDAIAVCMLAQNAVKARLSAPSTADFPGCGWSLGEYDIRVNPDRTLFYVKGYVDAQNGFGAKIRSNFIVTIRHSGATHDFSSLNVTDVAIE